MMTGEYLQQDLLFRFIIISGVC